MSRKKILFLSDAVSSTSGLGRITRDLALRVREHLGDVFEVASVGYGSPGSSKIPFKEYHLHAIENWLVPELPQVWNDFVGDEEGILFSVWDASRLYWLGIPQMCPNPQLRRWVETAKVKKWLYGAIDAEGPNGHLSHRIAETYKGFDRVIDYSAFSSKITGNIDHLPHGIDTSVFYPRSRKESRESFIQNGFKGLTHESLLIGIVATNQARKNWQLGMETCKILLERGHDVRLWAHIDIPERYWSIGNLIVDYGLVNRGAMTVTRFTDEQLATMYSACDVTLGIGPEGMGFPLMESLACGVPVVTGNYAAQAEYVPKRMLVDPLAFYHEGAFCSKRPAFSAGMWADTVEKSIGKEVSLPENLDWGKPVLWEAWQKWFLKGIE